MDALNELERNNSLTGYPDSRNVNNNGNYATVSGDINFNTNPGADYLLPS